MFGALVLSVLLQVVREPVNPVVRNYPTPPPCAPSMPRGTVCVWYGPNLDVYRVPDAQFSYGAIVLEVPGFPERLRWYQLQLTVDVAGENGACDDVYVSSAFTEGDQWNGKF